MCGICGIVHQDPSYPVSEPLLTAMRDTITYRGPDDAGNYLEPGVGLGSRRLAILDLSERGHMPMSTPDGRFWITYNGEVYNYRELRVTLEARGHRFHSNTDTEVILRLYAEEGPAMLDQLNGMFAIGIWDSKERTLFLARDHIGIKPLYYALQDNQLYFASEQKALFAAGVKAEFDQSTWEELLCFRFAAGEATPFVGVKRLVPGHYLLWKDGDIEIRRWWHLAERAQEIKGQLRRDPIQWYKEVFDESVLMRRISDVPVGVLLSGGLDSGSIAASLAYQTSSKIATFTVRFKEAGYDEGPLAKQIADQWGLEYHELIVSPDELMSRLHDAAWLNDEPQVHANDLHIWAISQYAKPLVTVLLSGEGSDETLGGYVRYQPLRFPFAMSLARPVLPFVASSMRLNARWGKLSKFLALGSMNDFVMFNSCDTLPADLEAIGMVPKLEFPYRQQVMAEARSLYPGEPMRQAMYSDQHTFICSLLDRNDRMTMGASIECRVPFLDRRIVQGVAALPSSVVLSGRRGKNILRQSIGLQLPKDVQNNRKWGFGVPWNRYLRQLPEFRDLVLKLPDLDPIREGPFNASLLRNVLNEFLKGGNQHEALVRQLFMITIWYQVFFKRSYTNLSSVADYHIPA